MDYSRYGGQPGAHMNAQHGQPGGQDPAAAYASAPYAAQQYNYVDPYAQQQQYQVPPPQIRNPFAPPQVSNSALTGHNAAYDPEYEAQVAQWQSTYAPAGELPEKGKKGKQDNANFAPLGVRQEAGVNTPTAGSTSDNLGGRNHPVNTSGKTVIRKGGGQTWEDQSLLEWDPTQFRIMVGNLAGEVTDDSLAKAFAAYGVSKARVVRDKRSTKSKGYGFVSFHDGEKGFKAAREMVGKYIGSHPVTIKRSTANVTPVTAKSNDKYNKKKHHSSGHNSNNKTRTESAPDPLRAHTGAHIEKKPVRNQSGLKLLG